MPPANALLRIPLPLSLLALLAGAGRAQNLEIHYINVGWGGSVLVRGPNGTTVLLEAGKTHDGADVVVPYLDSIGIPAAMGLDYMILGHHHNDHVGGMDEVIEAGYDVHVANYENGSTEPHSSYDQWVEAAQGTTAGAPVPMPVGAQILLGNGATLTCVARNGSILGGGSVPVDSENDRSIAVLVQYGGFDFLWASDLGGGEIDQSCTGRSTSAADVETAVIQAISPGGANPMISSGGIDVLHCNHHGSETSTNKNWMNLARPAVAVISIGAGQSSGDDRPRIDVVESVLLAEAPCITVPPALVLQTEEGDPSGSNTSFAGYCVGDVQISTDGVSAFTVSADGQVTEGPDERAAAGLPHTFPLDDVAGPPDTTPPVLSDVHTASIAGDAATISWTTDEASGSVVQYGPTTGYGSTASVAALVTSHSVSLTGLSADTVYHYRAQSSDGWGNTAVDVDRSFQTGGMFGYAPSATTLLEGTLNSGTVSNLATDNGSYYKLNSTTSGTRKTDWYGSVSVGQAPASIAALAVEYRGKYSKTVTQTLHLWDWTASSWVQINSKSAGTSEKSVTVAFSSPAAYVSSTGEVRLRVRATRNNSSFTSSGELMKFTVETPGTSL
ncbi:MAG TPA: fibronectin type III domain-containing protein [Planctomycetota bacterium]|jgi:beta-lactamase superfamily II metal-dependent hydrolase|nr:fibronectin type III domain-containing protein [Planctomycetota bacterium]